MSFAVIGMYPTSVPTGTDGPSNFWPHIFSNAVLPSAILSRCASELFGIVCVNYFRFRWRRKKSLWTRHCFRCFFCLHRITLNPIREIILHDSSVFVSASRHVFHVQNFVICRVHLSELCRTCNPVYALLRFYSTPGPCCFCLLTNLTIGVFRIMSEHIVVFSWLGTDDTFLTLGIFCQSISSRMGGNRGKFLIKRSFFDNSMLRVTPNCRSWGRCISFFSNPSVNGCNRSNMVSSTSCFRSRFPLTVENSLDGTAFCLVPATMWTKFFDVAFDYFLTFW